jgi:hypothetical protein
MNTAPLPQTTPAIQIHSFAAMTAFALELNQRAMRRRVFLALPGFN